MIGHVFVLEGYCGRHGQGEEADRFCDRGGEGWE